MLHGISATCCQMMQPTRSLISGLARTPIDAVTALARPMLEGRWDEADNLLGYYNGVAVDTQTGDLVGMGWQHYISRYLPDAVYSETDKVSLKWESFVFDSLSHYELPDRYDVAKYLQQWTGAALAGEPVANQAMVFLHGRPGTGKSTFAETVKRCFGDYGAVVSGRRMVKEHNDHPQWLAGLQRKRLVVISEIPRGGQWQTDTLNNIVSGESIEANRMRQNSINFTSIAHVLAYGNHKPSAESESGIWRRLRLVQFENKPEVENPHLGKELQAELPGVFNWILKGLQDWIANGRTLTTPSVLLANTDAYRQDVDYVKQWADDRLVVDKTAMVKTVDLYTDFSEWWKVNVSDKPPSPQTLSRRLNDMGHTSSQRASGGRHRIRQGLRLLAQFCDDVGENR